MNDSAKRFHRIELISVILCLFFDEVVDFICLFCEEIVYRHVSLCFCFLLSGNNHTLDN